MRWISLLLSTLTLPFRLLSWLHAAVPPSPVAALDAARSSMQIVLVTVENAGDSHAVLQLYEKSGSIWRQVVRDAPARVGRNGVAYNRKQDSLTTPAGNFGFVYLFGNQPDPGTHPGYAYRQTTAQSHWVLERNHPAYNRWVEGNPGAQVETEHLRSIGIAYNYAAVLDFNYHEPVHGDGGAIFLHAFGPRRAGTGGCIALEEATLLTILRRLDPAKNPRIIICPISDLSQF